MAEPSILYKLIILHLLNKVDFPLTNSQISEFILDKGYTNYFKLQQVLSELCENGFITEESSHNRTLYHITEEGIETIHFFKNDISPAIQQDIDAFLAEKQFDLKNESSVKADYYQNSNMEYSVRCQVIEKDSPLIDLTIVVPTENEAKKAVMNWSEKNAQLYALIMGELL